MFFGSDNTAPVADGVMQAVLDANRGNPASYGGEAAMEEVRALVRRAFDAPEAAVYLVPTGTAANALSLALHCPVWGTVYAHEAAHIEVDECGAPEFFIGGGKIRRVAGAHGKMTSKTLGDALAATPVGDVHASQPGALSLTNLTEAGTAYSAGELGALTAMARDAGIATHLDGARFANALVSSGRSPAEISWKAGVDVLSLGGTKNGCMGVEAVVIFDPAKAWEFELRRKRGGHLFSKHRYLSAQMLGWLRDDLWLDLARQANRRATDLARGLEASPGVTLLHPVEGNMIFARLPRAAHERARAAGAAYFTMSEADDAVIARLVASWSTRDEEVSGLLAALAG
ncbi:MAG: beta-eliminating lyase-related protein [Paracoccaceae bacterium]